MAKDLCLLREGNQKRYGGEGLDRVARSGEERGAVGRCLVGEDENDDLYGWMIGKVI